MPTHDYVIDNQSASAFRADLNSVLQAILTQNSSATAPTTATANMIWYDTANNQLKKRNEAGSAWIVLGTIDEALGTFTPSGERALASQAQAEAGSDNTTLMTPLRTAQAIAALAGAIDYQAFTESGTWTKPAGLSANAIVIVEAWGGGGGGNRCPIGTDRVSAGGGGGGYFTHQFLASSLTATVAVGVASGGAGGTTDTTGVTAASGGDSTFGSYLTAFGGGGGRSGTSSTATGGSGGSFEAGSGIWSGNGATDSASNTAATNGIFWGGGGGGAGIAGNGVGASGFFGAGGGGGGDAGGTRTGGTSRYAGSGGNGGATGAGTNGTAPGGGGGGGRGGNGGSGARGEVRVWTIG